MLIPIRSCVRHLHRPDFSFYVDYFLFLISLRKLIVKIGKNGPLAQSGERDANNAIMCSRLIWTIFLFLCGLLSVFN